MVLGGGSLRKWVQSGRAGPPVPMRDGNGVAHEQGQCRVSSTVEEWGSRPSDFFIERSAGLEGGSA